MVLNKENGQVEVLTSQPYHLDASIMLWDQVKVTLNHEQELIAKQRAKLVLAGPAFQNSSKRYDHAGVAENTTHALVAEMAVSVAMGISCMVKDPFSGDLEGGIEVRTSQNPGSNLLVRSHDHLERPFVFVTGKGREWLIHGWQLGQHVMDNGRMLGSEKMPFWICPREELFPIGGLIREFHRQRVNFGTVKASEL